MSPAVGKALELERKLGSFPEELNVWMAASELNQPFEKHHTQIRRLVLQLTGLHQGVVDELALRIKEGTLFRFALSIERRALAVHTVWDFFRSKLALRAVEPSGSFLKTADGFARECYAVTGGALREPPLVTFDNQVSPWALSRESTYTPASDPGGFLSLKAFSAVIEKLPVPLLGLPWHYATYLPHVVFLAHEAGHAYERDYQLDALLEAALSNADLAQDHRDAWQAWRREVYADLHAIYTAGPAYARALAELLPAERSQIEGESKPLKYPTRALRILLNTKALELNGHATEAAAIEKAWRLEYPVHTLAKWEDDLPVVITAMYAAAKLPAELAWTAAHAAQARTVAGVVRAGAVLDPNDVYPVRVMVAASRELFDAPQLWPALIQHVVCSRPPGLLAGETQRADKLDGEAEKKAGAGLAADLFVGIEEP